MNENEEKVTPFKVGDENSLSIAVQALEDIVSPIAKMRRELKEDERLDGQYAYQLSRDPRHLQSIAESAISALTRASEAKPTASDVETPAPLDIDELWDKYSYYVDTDLSAFEYVSGRSVILQADFKSFMRESASLIAAKDKQIANTVKIVSRQHAEIIDLKESKNTLLQALSEAQAEVEQLKSDLLSFKKGTGF